MQLLYLQPFHPRPLIRTS